MTPVSAGAGELDRPVAAVPPGERGGTRIADRVVAKIASQAAREAVGTLPPDAGRPSAGVVVHHEVAHVRVHVELEYPCDVGERCRRVRHQVAERVSTLAGMEVPEVVVQVERLHPVAGHGAAQGRTR
ncbi:Asp23/Gls24 family envelope stress response protein [Streptomyces sp. CA-179760]|uniref:Asp23/Gls24 family envelope stress response protein n=1 Tax=Streptomyces sp. CA-179760 TaxID=3240054 RepID=UPI003D94F06F